MKDVLNRLPTKPNRKLITYSDGEQEYVTIEYADEPTEQGTRIDKGLFDSIKGDVYRVDKYTEPDYYEEHSISEEKSGTYIPLWGNSHYTKCGMIVGATNENEENYAYKAMNGVDGYWEGSTVPAVAAPTIFSISFYEPISIREFTISGYDNTLYCKRFSIYGSNDGDNWYEVTEVVNNTYQENTYTVTGTTLYRLYQIRIIETASATSNPAILEFNITKWTEYKKANKIALSGIPLTEYGDKQRLLLTISDKAINEFNDNIIPPMHVRAYKGFFVQSSGDLINTSVTDAFDYDNENTYWGSVATATDRYLQVTSPINIKPSEITLKVVNVLNGKLQGSNDGDSWEDLYTNINTADGTTREEKVLSIETDKKYRYFRFICSAYASGESTLVYQFAINAGYRGLFDYSNDTYIDINSLGNRAITTDSIMEEGNYEFVYDEENLMYAAFLNSFSRENVENTFTEGEKQKLAGIEVGAEVNVVESIKVNGVAKSVDGNKAVNISAIPLEEKGTRNGVATLDANGKIPNSELPEIEATVGTLYTTSDTALQPINGESFNNDIELHKVSKTGNYNDLIDKPEIVTSISGTSTDQQVPSAKAVYTSMQEIYQTINQIEITLSEI